ncbi:MAG TPA: GAF domain-containing protein [Thermoanaerobaculia bacterium]|nr:GAF domain-containing protein [Thermoanaerobaculia bacterium]
MHHFSSSRPFFAHSVIIQTLSPSATTWWSCSPEERSARRENLVTQLRRRLQPPPADGDGWGDVLLEVATALGFSGVALWLPGSDSLLRCKAFAANVVMDLFEEQTRMIAFASGVGMPGRTLAHGVPEWIPNVIHDDNFPRLRGAIRDLVRAVVAFPVRVDGQIVAVVEMFSRTVLQPDPETSEVLLEIGRAIGRSGGLMRSSLPLSP